MKFDPSSRFPTHDRERCTQKGLEKETVSNHTDYVNKEKERDRKCVSETRKDMDGYVGFANLPNQVYRKSVKRGFEFTLMVVGAFIG